MEKSEYLDLIEYRAKEICDAIQMHRAYERMYSHYTLIVEQLNEVLEDIRDHPLWGRPGRLPDETIWSNACNTDDQSNPYEYKADMPVEDFQRMQDEYFVNEDNEILDAEDFRGEVKAEEGIENDEENKSAAGINGCDTGCTVDGNVECRTSVDGENRVTKRFYTCSVNGKSEVYCVVSDKQQHEIDPPATDIQGCGTRHS